MPAFRLAWLWVFSIRNGTLSSRSSSCSRGCPGDRPGLLRRTRREPVQQRRQVTSPPPGDGRRRGRPRPGRGLQPGSRAHRAGPPEEDLQRFRADTAALRLPFQRFRSRGAAVRPAGVMGQDACDHVLFGRGGIDLRSAELGMAEHGLHVGQRHGRVPRHPVCSGMAQIVQRPVRPEQGTGPDEHRPGSVIGQQAERPAERPPQRLVPARRDLALHLGLVEAQPYERVRGRRQPLHGPRSLPDHRDQLLARIGVLLPRSQQFRGPAPVDTQKRPAPGRGALPSLANSSLNSSSGMQRGIRLANSSAGKGRALVPEFHRVVMRMRPAAARRPAGTGSPSASQSRVQLIKAPQHRLAMGWRGSARRST